MKTAEKNNRKLSYKVEEFNLQVVNKKRTSKKTVYSFFDGQNQELRKEAIKKAVEIITAIKTSGRFTDPYNILTYTITIIYCTADGKEYVIYGNDADEDIENQKFEKESYFKEDKRFRYITDEYLYRRI